jgi:hypothetical protein
MQGLDSEQEPLSVLRTIQVVTNSEQLEKLDIEQKFPDSK